MDQLEWLKEEVKQLVVWDGSFLNIRIDEAVINSFFGEEGKPVPEDCSLAIKDSTNRLIMCNRHAKRRGILPYKTLEPVAKRIDPAIQIISTSKKPLNKPGKREKGEDDDGFKEIKEKKDKIKAILAEYDPKINELAELKADQVVLDLKTTFAQRKASTAPDNISDKLLLSLIIQEISSHFKSSFHTNVEMGFGHSSLIASFVTGKLTFEETYFAPAFAANWSNTAKQEKDRLMIEYFKKVALVTDLQDMQGVGEKTEAELKAKNFNTPWDIYQRLDSLFLEEGLNQKLVLYVCNFFGVDRKEAPILIDKRKRLEMEAKKKQKQALKDQISLIQKVKPIYPEWNERKRPLKPKTIIASIEEYRPTRVEFQMIELIFQTPMSKVELQMLSTLKSVEKSKSEVDMKRKTVAPREKIGVKRNPRMIIVQTRMTRGFIPNPKHSAELLADYLSKNLASENLLSRVLKLTAKLGQRDKPIYQSFIKLQNKQVTSDAHQLLAIILRDDIFARSDAGTPIIELKVSAIKLIDAMTFQMLLAKEAAKELSSMIAKKKRRRTGVKRVPRELTVVEKSLYSLFEIGRNIESATMLNQKALEEDKMLRSLAGLDLLQVERPEHFASLIRICRQQQHLIFDGPSLDPMHALMVPDLPLELEPKNPAKQRQEAFSEKSPLKSLQKDAPTNFKIDHFYQPKPVSQRNTQEPEAGSEVRESLVKYLTTAPEDELGKRGPFMHSKEEFARLFPQFGPAKKLSAVSTEDLKSVGSGSEQSNLKITKEGNCQLI